jgi:hypothetical protein
MGDDVISKERVNVMKCAELRRRIAPMESEAAQPGLHLTEDEAGLLSQPGGLVLPGGIGRPRGPRRWKRVASVRDRPLLRAAGLEPFRAIPHCDRRST